MTECDSDPEFLVRFPSATTNLGSCSREKVGILAAAFASSKSMAKQSQTGNSPIVCSLSPEELSNRRDRVIHELFQKTLERYELTDGLHFMFPSSEVVLAELFEFIRFERNCCKFLSFELIFDASDGPIHLRLRGREGAKEAIRQIFA